MCELHLVLLFLLLMKLTVVALGAILEVTAAARISTYLIVLVVVDTGRLL